MLVGWLFEKSGDRSQGPDFQSRGPDFEKSGLGKSQEAL